MIEGFGEFESLGHSDVSTTMIYTHVFKVAAGGPPNAWLGVSVENRKHGVPRIDVLRTVNVKVRFLSVEPLLEDLGVIDLEEIHWVIVGGESGHKARPMRKEWVDHVKRQCDQAEVAFFFKQWGAWGVSAPS